MSRRVAATSGGSGVRHAVHSIDWGERLVVEPRTFAALFTNNALVVPLFQRAYCWDERNVRQWWRDAVCERRDDIHSCGPCVFYRSTTHSRDDSAQPVLVCIDGQQRCTTMQLLIICLRDAALSVDASALATRLGRLLHRDGAAEPRACVFGVGAPPPRGFAPTLLPSFADRAPFFTLLAQQAGPKPSMMATAKRVMDYEIASARGRLGADAFVEWLEAAATRSLARMALMYIEVRSTSIDPGQIFLWLQEKALWSDGAALSSSSPAAAGRTFRAADLVRNFVLAASANLPLREQEATLREQWIDPIERVVFERAVEAGGRAAAAQLAGGGAAPRGRGQLRPAPAPARRQPRRAARGGVRAAQRSLEQLSPGLNCSKLPAGCGRACSSRGSSRRSRAARRATWRSRSG
jgi:hypothetical protein